MIIACADLETRNPKSSATCKGSHLTTLEIAQEAARGWPEEEERAILNFAGLPKGRRFYKGLNDQKRAWGYSIL